MEWPTFAFVRRVDVGAMLDQEADHVHMAGIGGLMEAGAAGPVGDVDVGEARDDELGASAGIIGCCYVERSLPVLVP